MTDSAYQQWTDALDLLRTATPGTPRELIAWAVGVALGQHAVHIVGQWLGDPIVGHEFGGCNLTDSTDPCRNLDHGRGEAAIIERHGNRKHTIATVTAADVAHLLDQRRVPAHLLAEVDASLVARTAHVAASEPVWQQRPIEWHHARTEEWLDIEDRCRAAGAAVWASVKPTTFVRQLDLFATAA